MDRRAVNILLVAGLALAVMYAVLSVGGYGHSSSGAFTAAPSAVHAVYAAVVALLALFGVWLGRRRGK